MYMLFDLLYRFYKSFVKSLCLFCSADIVLYLLKIRKTLVVLRFINSLFIFCIILLRHEPKDLQVLV